MRRMEDEEPHLFRCNGCWGACDPKEPSVATPCQHLYCIACCQTILESNDPTCPICNQLIQKSNVKVVHVQSSSSDLRLQLSGQAPQVALDVALQSINFYNKQQKLYAEYAQQQSQRKISKTQEQCRKKLQEVHNGYLQAKRKYQEVLAQKHALQEDNKELQDKYNQKAMQDKKLKEGFARLQQENELLRRKLMEVGASGGVGGMAGVAMGMGVGGGGGASGAGRASRMGVLGLDEGMVKRPGTAIGARAIQPDPSPVQSLHMGFGAGYGFDTPDNPPAMRQAMISGGMGMGGGQRMSGGMGMGGGGSNSGGMPMPMAMAMPGMGGQGLMGSQALQNKARQGMGFNASFPAQPTSLVSI